jgi:hypothetical protein
MKALTIEIRINEGKIATGIKSDGFDESISSQLEILGLIENTKGIINERIKKLFDKSN